MNFTVSGEIARHLLTMTKKDGKLAQAMAREFIAAVEPSSIASYLLTVDVAVDLLASRIKKNPEKTIKEIQALPMLETPRKTPVERKRDRPASVIKKSPASRRKRRRLSVDQIEKLKGAIVAFLRQHPGSNRKQITEAVSFPSVAAYNRIMSEMKSAKHIVAKGEKSKTVYTVKGGSALKARKAATKTRKASTKTRKAATKTRKAATKTKTRKAATKTKTRKAATKTRKAATKTRKTATKTRKAAPKTRKAATKTRKAASGNAAPPAVA